MGFWGEEERSVISEETRLIIHWKMHVQIVLDEDDDPRGETVKEGIC